MGETKMTPDSEKGPARLGKYDIVVRLGQGGMSKVYLAVSRGAVDDVRKLVVLKVLHDHLATDEEYVQMFLREARVAVDLSHPNVIHTYTVGQEEGRYCIVMEYLNGIPLGELLKFARSWSFEQRLPLLGALCLMLSGLNYVHDYRDFEGNALELVHRDLKPGNVLIGFDGQVKLLDFGVVKLTAPEYDQTQRLSVKGTVQYIAPEALDGERRIDARYDLFAAGLMLWEVTTGRRFWGLREPLQIMKGLADNEMARIIEDADDVPDQLRPILHKALASEPGQRYQTALELKDDIQSFLISQRYRINPEDVAAIVTREFGAVYDERRRATHRTLKDFRERRAGLGSVEDSSEVVDSTPSSQLEGIDATEIAAPPSNLTPVQRSAPIPPPPPANDPARRRRPWIVAALVATPLLAFAGYAVSGSWGASEPEASMAGDRPGSTPSAAAPPRVEEPHEVSEVVVGDIDDAPTLEGAGEVVEVEVRVEPSRATLTVDGEKRAGSTVQLSGTDPDEVHRVVAAAQGYATETLEVRMQRSRTLELTLQPLEVRDEKQARRSPRRPQRVAPEPSASSAPPTAKPEKSKTQKSKTEKSKPVTRTPRPRPGDDLDAKASKRGQAIDAEIPWD